jgi:hypothetical protein
MTGRPFRTARPGPVPALRVLAIALLLAGVAASSLLAVGPAHAAGPSASASAPLTGSITGPSVVGTGLKASYTVSAQGGPAFAPNGTQVGILSYSASVAGTNATNVNLLPSAGVLTNGTVALTLTTTNLTQSLVLTVDVTSGHNGSNVSSNFTYDVQVVVPYTVAATLVVAGSAGSEPFAVQVLLDGNPVGSVSVPSLTAHANYALTFSYVDPGLSVGWHTFTLVIGNAHGLVQFANGQSSYAQSFYVAGPPTNFTPWYLVGAAAVVGAIFIWLTLSGARRRGRKR